MVPLLDRREFETLVKQIQEIYSYYTPDWRFSPEDPDPGTALLLIFAQQFAGTLTRFNQVPLKNYLAFLNMLRVANSPAQPAEAYVTFKLSEGTKETVLIPAGTQVAAEADGGEPVVFETAADLLATPALLAEAYHINPARDRIGRVAGDLWQNNTSLPAGPVRIFDLPEGENLQAHRFYLGHANIFNIQGTARLELQFINTAERFQEKFIAEKLADREQVEWLYLTGEGPEANEWLPFDEVTAERNRLILKKTKPLPIVESGLGGRNNCWLQCRTKRIAEQSLFTLNFNAVFAGAEFLDCHNQGGMAPDMVFCNDTQLHPDRLYPFGEYGAISSQFYLSSREALSKKGATIIVQFDLKFEIKKLKDEVDKPVEWKLVMRKSDLREPPPPPEISIAKVIWEYWNGNSWVKLFLSLDAEALFSGPSGPAVKRIEFQCPADIQMTMVNNHQNYWIRVRVLNLYNSYAPNAVFRTPLMIRPVLTYDFQGARFPVADCLSYNNLEWVDHSADLKAQDRPFAPLCTLDSQYAAFYMGFETPPLKGPISIYFALQPPDTKSVETPRVEWEYLSREGARTQWRSLKVLDGTYSLAASGNIVFAGPPDFAHGLLFGQNLYWIRAVNMGNNLSAGSGRTAQPVLNGIYLNTARVVQHETIEREIPELVQQGRRYEYQLSRFPVISEELWIDEVENLPRKEEQERIHPADRVVVRDEIGNIREFWVKWQPVMDFLESFPRDRHFIIDRTAGRISFGDGQNGRECPTLSARHVRVKYRIGGGKRGDVGAHTIIKLRNSISFVDMVDNPEPAFGGSDIETMEEVLRRGPQIIKHRNRAVTAEDFEWLVKQSSPNIAKVKCLPNCTDTFEKKTGFVTLLIVPKSEAAGPAFIDKLRFQVEKYLRERTAGVVAFPDKIRVVGPVALQLTVNADLAVSDPELVIPVEKTAIAGLHDFLDLFTGNVQRQGWEIGEFPHLSTFYTFLKAVKGVNYVKKVALSTARLKDGVWREADDRDLTLLPFSIITGGKHQINVKVI